MVLLHAMAHLGMSDFGINLGFISPGSYVHWGVNAWLEIDALRRMRMMLHVADIDVGTGAMDFTVDVTCLMGDAKDGTESCKELFTKGESVRVFLP